MSKLSTQWYLYILQCCDGTLYTGVTNNLDRRLELHNSGKASRYTRGRRPVEILYWEPCRSRSGALKKEYEIKNLTRRQKEDYVHLHAIRTRIL